MINGGWDVLQSEALGVLAAASVDFELVLLSVDEDEDDSPAADFSLLGGFSSFEALVRPPDGLL